MKKFEIILNHDDVYKILETIQKYDAKYRLDNGRFKLEDVSILALPENKVKLTISESDKKYIIDVLFWDLDNGKVTTSWEVNRFEKIRNSIEIDDSAAAEQQKEQKHELILHFMDFNNILTLNHKYCEFNLKNIDIQAWDAIFVKLWITQNQMDYLLHIASDPSYYQKNNTLSIYNVYLIKAIYETKIKILESKK